MDNIFAELTKGEKWCLTRLLVKWANFVPDDVYVTDSGFDMWLDFVDLLFDLSPESENW